MGACIVVYRPAERVSGDSVTDKVDLIVVVNLPGPFKPTHDMPAFKLVRHDRYPRHPALIPIDVDGAAEWYGPSGNYAGNTVTPGWTEAVERITGGPCELVPIYDDGFKGGAA